MSADVTRDEDRTEPPRAGDDRTLLTTFLDWHRQTLQWKCAGLSPRQLATRSVAPSELTLLGIIRHLTQVECGWFQRFDGTHVELPYASADDPDADLHVGDPAATDEAAVAEAWRRWHETVESSRRIVADTDLDAMSVARRGQSFSMRWILVHMLEEYARHNGHVDLIREALDGQTGE